MIDELIEAALKVRENAYAPYSQFKVGAAVLTANDEIFVGCNVENSSYGLAICAERQAIGAAIAAGFKQFKAVAIAATPQSTPCGACRQFMFEFGESIQVISVDAANPSTTIQWMTGELLPDGFHLDR